MLVRLKRWHNDVQAVEPELLLEYLRGTVNKRGVPRDDLEIYARTPLLVPKTESPDTAISWTFSTFDLDRYDERVDPAGWELERYLENPVVLWAHDHGIPAIGQSRELRADSTGLNGQIVFNTQDYDAFGWAIGERVRRNILRAGSVGFLVKEVEFPEKTDSTDGTSLIFRKQELLEFSICNVPANPHALANERATEAAALKTYQYIPWANLLEKAPYAAGFWQNIIQGE